MKIEIDISDFYFEEEGDLQEQLKRYVVNEAVNQIRQANKKLIDDVIKVEVTKEINKSLTETVQKDVIEIIETGLIAGKTVKETILNEFNRGHGWNSPNEQMKKMGEEFKIELRKRYDMAFAQQIITKMKELDFLKEGVIERLFIESPKSNS